MSDLLERLRERGEEITGSFTTTVPKSLLLEAADLIERLLDEADAWTDQERRIWLDPQRDTE